VRIAASYGTQRIFGAERVFLFGRYEVTLALDEGKEGQPSLALVAQRLSSTLHPRPDAGPRPLRAPASQVNQSRGRRMNAWTAAELQTADFASGVIHVGRGASNFRAN
jgi:hypothetical protein